MTARMQTYVDLHRHAAVRAELTGHPAVALRLMVAHAIAGSPLWNVRVEPQSAKDDDMRETVEVSRSEAVFVEKRHAVLALLGFGAGGIGSSACRARLWQFLLNWWVPV